jgi:formate dehydrogenase (NADP+) alpha subunit
VAGLAISFGSGAMTNSIKDISEASCIISIGSNTTDAHPVIGFDVKRAVWNGTKLIVINPREIALCHHADIWLRLNPGTDVALIMGMARIILEEGLHDSPFIEERCENFEAFKDSLADFPLEKVAQITGVPAEQIVEAAKLYATSKPAAILYTLGITEHTHGTEGVMSLANLAMLTGNIGKPGSGVNPLRGQNNVQGACDIGGLPGTYPGYQAVDNPDIRQKFEEAWGCTLNPEPGLALTDIFNAAYEKKLKAIYMVGEDPVMTEPDRHHTVESLNNLELFVIQDIFPTETTKLADVVLPAAGCAAYDGTFTNSERRVQRVRKIVAAPGEAKPDWEIVCMVAKKMGAKGFDYASASEIMNEIASLTPSYGGISYERIEKAGLQWPCPTPEHPGTPILHTSIFTRGKGKFMPLSFRPDAEPPDSEYPLVLTTDRSLYHYHAGSMTRRVNGLNILRGEELVEINPADSAALNISDGEMVTVYSRRGKVDAKAKVTEASAKGLISMTFHFRETPTNILTTREADPISKTPQLKYCAVRVEKKAPD